MAADACCGQTEQTHQPQLTSNWVSVPAPTFAVAPLAVTLPDVQWSHQHAAAVTFERTIQKRPHSPPSFLASVLLI
jgi:hypothetical protein